MGQGVGEWGQWQNKDLRVFKAYSVFEVQWRVLGSPFKRKVRGAPMVLKPEAVLKVHADEAVLQVLCSLEFEPGSDCFHLVLVHLTLFFNPVCTPGTSLTFC